MSKNQPPLLQQTSFAHFPSPAFSIPYCSYSHTVNIFVFTFPFLSFVFGLDYDRAAEPVPTLSASYRICTFSLCISFGAVSQLPLPSCNKVRYFDKVLSFCDHRKVLNIFGSKTTSIKIAIKYILPFQKLIIV